MSSLQTKIKQISQQLLEQQQEFEFKKPLLQFLNQVYIEQGKIQVLQDKLEKFIELLGRYLKTYAHVHKVNEEINEEDQENLDETLKGIEVFYHDLHNKYEEQQHQFKKKEKVKLKGVYSKNKEAHDANDVLESQYGIAEDDKMTQEKVELLVQTLDKEQPCILSFSLTENSLYNLTMIVQEMLSCDWLKDNICLNLCKSRKSKLNDKCLSHIRELSELLSPGEYQNPLSFLFKENNEKPEQMLKIGKLM